MMGRRRMGMRWDGEDADVDEYDHEFMPSIMMMLRVRRRWIVLNACCTMYIHVCVCVGVGVGVDVGQEIL
jgi:hypothetical protein